MALYAERAGADLLTGQEIVEQLGAWLASQYQQAETFLLAEVARGVANDWNTDDAARRLRTITRLRRAAEKAVAAIDSADAAARIVQAATREGTAAAIEQLGFARAAAGGTAPGVYAGTGVPFATGLTPQASLAAAQIGLELTSALADLDARILRAVPDAYQTTIARFANERLLGVTGRRQTHTRAIADFLSQGLTGFTDQGGRRWTIGAYSEMAARTATNRAWIDAHRHSWSAQNLDLVTIVRGSDSCQSCAAWSGKILNSGAGPTGEVTAEHATTGQPVTITVAGSLADARAAGWNHPNCRCTLAPVFPGLSLPAATESTYDPQQEKDRERLRYLERRVRGFKRKEALASSMGDDVGAAFYRRKVRAEQGRIRDHVGSTRQLRKSYREQLSYADGGPTRTPPPAAPKPPPTIQPGITPKPKPAPVVEPIPEAKTRVGLRDHFTADELAKRLGQRHPGLVVEGLEELDQKSAWEVVSTLDKLLDAHPYARLERISVKPPSRFGSKDTIAHAGASRRIGGPETRDEDGLAKMTAGFIELNSRTFTRDVLEEANAMSGYSGWTTQGPGVWTAPLTHEFGHVLDNSGNQAVRNDHGGYAREVQRAMDERGVKHERHGYNVGEKWNPAGAKWWEKQTTKYGRSNRAEEIAEAFAQVTLHGYETASDMQKWLYDRTIAEAKKRGTS